MLDNLRQIHERDKKDMLGIAAKQWQQYKYNFKFHWMPSAPIYEVMVSAVGNEAVTAEAYKLASEVQVPFEVIRDYSLPDRTTPNSLLICLSNSGNDEEIISTLKVALSLDPTYQRPMIVVASAGGQLLALARKHKLAYVELPKGYKAGQAVGFVFRAIAEIFTSTPLIDGEIKLIEAAADSLKKEVPDWVETVPVAKNFAKRLALEIIGRSAVIYSGPSLAPIANKWKINLNQNAKNVAWSGQFPEFAHSDMLGWTSQPIEKPYAVIELRSDRDDPRIRQRFEITNQLLSGKKPHSQVIACRGDGLLEQMMWAIALGDFVGIYLALANNVDPYDLAIFDKLISKEGE